MLCPYCGNDFNKELTRKIKCKKCGNFVFIRSIKGIKTPMTEEQKDKFDYTFSVTPFGLTTIEQIIESYNKEISVARKELISEFGYEPLPNDAIWMALNKELLKNFSDCELGIFRNTKMAMAWVLCNDERYLQALGLVLDVLILDVCGADNINLEFQKKSEMFNPKLSFISMALIDWLQKAKIFLNISDNNFKDIFLERYELLKISLQIPLDKNNIFKKIIDNFNTKN